MENEIISSNQSGHKPRGSCINQLLFIAHEICKPLDCGYVRGGFPDNSEAFDKIQHNGVIFEVEQNGISDNLSMV